ncbi:MAG: hypothetical protein QW270_03485 [Candidatus Bathyarchaeia archaeon]
MPAITPSYLYTFIALIAVSSLLTASFVAYASALRSSSEARKLKNLMDYVAAESTKLLTLTLTTNATATAYLQMPTAIGERQYWLELHNDSVKAWLEGGFGNSPVEGVDLRVYLPNRVLATGYYISGYGAAQLKCQFDADVLCIQLASFKFGE